MIEARAALLGELLGEMVSEHPDGFIPDAVWGPAQRAFALPYIELCIVRRNAESGWVQILLTHRTDEHWHGWHIPGGLWRTPWSFSQGLSSIFERELGSGVEFRLLCTGQFCKWEQHPYGHPISHIAIIEAAGIAENETTRWFDGVPPDMIADGGYHSRFIEEALRQAEGLV